MHRDRVTMPAKQFRAIREKFSLTRDAYALELGYEGSRGTNRNTIKRFEQANRPVPLPVARLAWLIDQHGLPDWPPELEAIVLEETSNG